MTVIRNAANLPYPDGSDPVRNGDNVMKALADTIASQQPVTVRLDMTGGNIVAGGTIIPLPATAIAPVAWPRTFLVLVSHTCTAATSYVDVNVRQGAVDLKRARMGVNGSVTVVASFDLPANTATSINVQATTPSGATATLQNDARWAHVDLVAMPVAVAV